MPTLGDPDQPELVLDFRDSGDVGVSNRGQSTVDDTVGGFEIPKLKGSSGAKCQQLAAVPALPARFAKLEGLVECLRGLGMRTRVNQRVAQESKCTDLSLDRPGFPGGEQERSKCVRRTA